MILEQEKLLSTDDQALGGRVLTNLSRSAIIESPPDLRISICGGVVRLEGRVLLPAEKTMIEDVVRCTDGVLSVENALRVYPCAARRSP